MKDTDKISKEQKRRNVVLASEIRESMRLTEEMLKAGQEALFDVAPDWTMQEREDLARAVFESMRSARAQPAAQRQQAAEIERLTTCLRIANDQAEHFEREWYLRGDEIERLKAGTQPAAQPLSVTDEMLMRFLGWPLPKGFAPDCGISFDGRKDDPWNKNKTWPIGTNLLTADQAKAMLEHVLGIAKDAP